MVLTLVTVMAGAVALGAAVVARHRAQAAADLAALSAGLRLAAGQTSACAAAGSVAASMGAGLAGCTVDGLDVTVRIEVGTRPGAWVLGPATATARAGPVGSP